MQLVICRASANQQLSVYVYHSDYLQPPVSVNCVPSISVLKRLVAGLTAWNSSTWLSASSRHSVVHVTGFWRRLADSSKLHRSVATNSRTPERRQQKVADIQPNSRPLRLVSCCNTSHQQCNQLSFVNQTVVQHSPKVPPGTHTSSTRKMYVVP